MNRPYMVQRQTASKYKEIYSAEPISAGSALCCLYGLWANWGL